MTGEDQREPLHIKKHPVTPLEHSPILDRLPEQALKHPRPRFIRTLIHAFSVVLTVAIVVIALLFIFDTGETKCVTFWLNTQPVLSRLEQAPGDETALTRLQEIMTRMEPAPNNTTRQLFMIIYALGNLGTGHETTGLRTCENIKEQCQNANLLALIDRNIICGKCPNCQGRGMVKDKLNSRHNQISPSSPPDTRICPACNGKKYVYCSHFTWSNYRQAIKRANVLVQVKKAQAMVLAKW